MKLSSVFSFSNVFQSQSETKPAKPAATIPMKALLAIERRSDVVSSAPSELGARFSEPKEQSESLRLPAPPTQPGSAIRGAVGRILSKEVSGDFGTPDQLAAEREMRQALRGYRAVMEEILRRSEAEAEAIRSGRDPGQGRPSMPVPRFSE